MHTLYPAIKPFKIYELPVKKPHVLYLEETGNPEGLPVLVVHSGPGAGGDVQLRRFFDPSAYRIINFDQRGCGRSTPYAETKNNDTESLIADIEAIRVFLGLEGFVLCGGGWGALLSLLYAQQYPQWVQGLILHRIFLGRKKDVSWLYQHGANLIYPDYWQEFINLVPQKEQHKVIQYYVSCLQGDNELARMAAAKNWAQWQARCCSLQPNSAIIDHFLDPHFALALATLESHYLSNDFFIKENQVIDNAHKIPEIPTYIIHGRYDMISPLSAAWALHQALPASNLRMVRDAGHSDRESGIIDAVIAATKEISGKGLDAC